MKLILSICKNFSCFCLVVYTFSSCKTTLTVNGGIEVPKKVTISITGDATTGNLTMKDEAGNPADVFKVWAGQKIKWEIDHSTIKSINAMPPKPTNHNAIFEKEPHKKFLSKNWQGTTKDEGAIKENNIKDSLGVYNYDYNIEWSDKDGKKHTYDPRIQVK